MCDCSLFNTSIVFNVFLTIFSRLIFVEIIWFSWLFLTVFRWLSFIWISPFLCLGKSNKNIKKLECICVTEKIGVEPITSEFGIRCSIHWAIFLETTYRLRITGSWVKTWLAGVEINNHSSVVADCGAFCLVRSGKKLTGPASINILKKEIKAPKLATEFHP